jgi:hypothetical protein
VTIAVHPRVGYGVRRTVGGSRHGHHASCSGSLRSGLWPDDTASGVRPAYRKALEEDGLSDEQTMAKAVAGFAPDLADNDAAPGSGSRGR